MPVARSAEDDWTGPGSLGIWTPYPWECGEVFDLLVGHKTVLHKRPLDGNVPLACRALPAGVVRFGADPLLLIDEARTRNFGSDGSLGWPLMQ